MDGKKQKIVSAFFYIFAFSLLAFAAVLVWPVYRKYTRINEHVMELKEELSRKNDECAELNKLVHDLEHRPAAVERVAREKFGFCKDGEIILKYQMPSSKTLQ